MRTREEIRPIPECRPPRRAWRGAACAAETACRPRERWSRCARRRDRRLRSSGSRECGRHQIRRFDFDVRRRERDLVRACRLGADERDVPRVVLRRIRHETRVLVSHEFDRRIGAASELAREIGRDTGVFGRARRDEQKVAVIERRPQPAVGRQLLARGLRHRCTGPTGCDIDRDVRTIASKKAQGRRHTHERRLRCSASALRVRLAALSHQVLLTLCRALCLLP